MRLPENFLRAMAFVQKSEGGTNFDPIDRGGFTNFGLSEKQYPDLDLKNITFEQAMQIYFDDYWIQNSCHMLESPVGIALFDSCVNCGPVAKKWLQEAINGDNHFIEVDWIIGAQTIIAAQAQPSYRISGRLIGYRIQHYADLIKKYPEQVKYIRGWSKRAGYLLQYI